MNLPNLAGRGVEVAAGVRNSTNITSVDLHCDKKHCSWWDRNGSGIQGSFGFFWGIFGFSHEIDPPREALLGVTSIREHQLVKLAPGWYSRS